MTREITLEVKGKSLLMVGMIFKRKINFGATSKRERLKFTFEAFVLLIETGSQQYKPAACARAKVWEPACWALPSATNEATTKKKCLVTVAQPTIVQIPDPCFI